MGGVLSSSGTKRKACQEYEECYNASSKRRKMSSRFHDETQRLIPSFPDELSLQILARLPRISYFNLRLVSQKWKETITSPELYKLRKELGLTEEWLYVLTKVEEDKLSWYALDPLSRKWQRLPPMPSVVYAEESWKGSSGPWLWNIVGTSIRLVEFVRGWLGQKGTFDQMPFCGCTIGALDGYLYVIGGISRTSTMRCAWRYDPILNQWSEINSMSTSRAYSKTGILDNKLYVVGGLSRGPRGLIPLQSAEVFDPSTGSWSEVPSMPFSRAQVLPAVFLSDMLKPIATGMTTYKGKLCVPQSLYSWPFVVDIGGEIYDPELNSWADMPAGMGEGWPARQAGTKLSVVVDGELYAVDPSNSAENGKIKVYDQTEDAWKVVIGKLPNYDFTDSESPILLAGFHGKIHVIAKDANHNVAVMQALPVNNFCSSPCSSSVSAFSPLDEQHPSPGDSETVIWKDVAHRNFGSVELVSCQVLDV